MDLMGAGGKRNGLGGAVALSLLVLLGFAPTAMAGRVELRDGGETVTYRGDSGADAVTLSRFIDGSGGAYYLVTELGGISPGPGCFRVSSSTASCAVSNGLKRYAFTMHGGNDQLDVAAETAGGTADLGDGDDRFAGMPTGTAAEVVKGGNGNDAIEGGGGDDQVAGQAGDDSVDGGAGDDQLEYAGADMEAGAGAGSDDLHGGDGLDRLSYNDRDQGVRVVLDEQPGDGAEGEQDNVHGDVEWIVGSTLDDVLVGDDGAQRLYGHGGSDSVSGGGGADLLNGGTGKDALFGGPGDDTLEGSADGDHLDGGAGADRFEGDNPCSAEPCSGGPDEILARDGEIDQVLCGVGIDSAQVDAADVVATVGPDTCENVDRPPGPTPSSAAAGVAGVAGATTTSAPTLRVLGSRRLRTLTRDGLKLELTCPAPCRFTARLAHGRNPVALTQRATLRKGTTRITLKLGLKGRRRVARLRRLRLALTVTVTDAVGHGTVLRRSLRFRR